MTAIPPRLGLAAAAVLAAWQVAVLAAGVPGQQWRAAALASFDEAWQVISDTYYDPTFGGLDWAAVRRDLRPRVEAADQPAEARAALRAMLARLGRSCA